MSESQPRVVVVLGASRSRSKFGNKAVRAYRARGDRVLPVNPHADEIEGVPAWGSLRELPVEKVNIVSVYLPAEIGIGLLDEIAALDPDEVWFNPGSESEELMARAAARNLPVIQACSILGSGQSPSDFQD